MTPEADASGGGPAAGHPAAHGSAHSRGAGTTLEKPPGGAGHSEPPGPPGPEPPGSETAPDGAAGGPGAGEGKAGRFWSVRRAPAGIAALLLFAGTGVFLYDVASVRADRPGMAWRRTLTDELAGRRLDDTYLLAGAAALAAIGLWLLVLALTPGKRSLLTMRPDIPQVRAGLERSAAALVLRDRAMEISGVQSVRVDVTRRRVRARATAHFRDLEEVRRDLDAVLGDTIGDLGLARRPNLSVHVRRPGKRR
ncbi:DUF6286 domain-containing protein [Streptomyces sp. 891-h]|uniref:DUF6286 domain-containing protein n=1 Tax=Streptomyces sp. 891-h TaxID=2720714 RepID=UPI001FA96CB8|nr:DUF6286 domain-containing protein [Streptomyces sp. 891-h]